MSTPKLTAAQLAAVTGEPGQTDYFGPHWARISALQTRYEKLEEKIGSLMTERADLEDEIAGLILDARKVIADARAALAAAGPPRQDVVLLRGPFDPDPDVVQALKRKEGK